VDEGKVGSGFISRTEIDENAGSSWFPESTVGANPEAPGLMGAHRGACMTGEHVGCDE
jgi:hypothetical protein